MYVCGQLKERVQRDTAAIVSLAVEICSQQHKTLHQCKTNTKHLEQGEQIMVPLPQIFFDLLNTDLTYAGTNDIKM